MLVNELSDEECSYLFECDEVIRFQSQQSEENNFTSKKYIALVERNVTKSEQIQYSPLIGITVYRINRLMESIFRTYTRPVWP